MGKHEIEKHIQNALDNKSQFELIFDALRLLELDFRFFKVSHSSFLPAARDYRNYIKGEHCNDRQSATFKTLRGRLGANSRKLYKSQRETFIKLICLVSKATGLPVPEALAENLWIKFKKAEIKWLASGRAN